MPELSKTTKRRLDQMNKALFPLKMRYKGDGNTFQCYYRGKGKNFWKNLGPDMEVAYSRALVIRKTLDDLPLVSKRKLTLEEFHDEWITTKSKLSPTTLQGYHYFWRAVPDHLKQRELGSITRDHVETALEEIEKPSMRSHAAGFLSTVFNAAVAAELIPKNPHPKAYKNNRRRIPNLTSEQLLAVLDNVSESARPAVVLAGVEGLRRGEIMQLKYGDFNFEKRQVRITKSRAKTYGKFAADEQKKTKTEEDRTLPLTPIAVRYLQPVIEGKDPEALLYPTFRTDLPERIKAACKKVGVPPMNLHGLRHLCISLVMEESGPAAAQALAGHKQISTTADIYGHLSSVYLARQMERTHMEPEIKSVREMAEALKDHEDPKVKLLAEKTSSMCARLCQT